MRATREREVAYACNMEQNLYFILYSRWNWSSYTTSRRLPMIVHCYAPMTPFAIMKTWTLYVRIQIGMFTVVCRRHRLPAKLNMHTVDVMSFCRVYNVTADNYVCAHEHARCNRDSETA